MNRKYAPDSLREKLEEGWEARRAVLAERRKHNTEKVREWVAREKRGENVKRLSSHIRTKRNQLLNKDETNQEEKKV